jgi:alpha-glucosidase
MINDWVWWKHGVIYHIYPLSFYDSNNDGFGDIRGIILKLDYLSYLGIDAIWVSPVMQSPLQDGGYDITDFTAIDPRFGTMDDFKDLITESHRRGIKVILDLVMNHTSNQHPWFIESASSRNNPMSDWYIWHDGRNGKRPNNWKSAVGGSAWKYHSGREQYYYHSFFYYQPDLNWRNRDMAETYFENIRFWLSIGVDGFRLDVINMVVKDKKFRNAPLFSRFPFFSSHSYTRNRPKSFKIVRRLRKLMDEFPEKMLLGEIYSPPPGDPRIAADYLGREKQLLNLAFDFSIIFRRWSAKQYFQCIESWMEAIPNDGWACHVFSNHDVFRFINRFGMGCNKFQKARIVATLLLTLKGTPVLYYGDEIGMRNSRILRRDMVDPLGKKYYPFYKGRDRARTPMQWDSSLNCGFSEVKPWLPLDSEGLINNVESNKLQSSSLLLHYRSLLKLRKLNWVLQDGDWVPIIEGNGGIIAYLRMNINQKILVVLNFSGRPKPIHLNFEVSAEVLYSTHRISGNTGDLAYIRLFPYEASLWKL